MHQLKVHLNSWKGIMLPDEEAQNVQVTVHFGEGL